jgi:endonuclease YncB( thermonuclease family)
LIRRTAAYESISPLLLARACGGGRRHLSAALFRLWTGDWNEAPLRNQPQPLGLPPGVYRVERVVDGDTLLIDGHRRVRLQGVNSPETVKPDSPIEPWGPEATAFTKDFVHAAGGSLRFEVDGETTDQHGRYLAFAFPRRAFAE